MSAAINTFPLLVGAPNFRDMGGYRAADSRTVRCQRLYRSEGLAQLTSEDLEVARSLGIQLICDLRSDKEKLQIPTRWPEGTGVELLQLNVTADIRAGSDSIAKALLDTPTAEGATQAMLLSYRQFPGAFARHLPSLFQRILTNGLPLVFHCAAGKDRTGFLAAILLAALGVSQENILEDYLLTSHYWKGPRSEESIKQVLTIIFGTEPCESVIQPLASVKEEYLAEAFRTICEQHGTVDTYLEKVAGLGPKQRETLQNLLLE
ncbi:tyrosine-protein phosphatase [Pseudomonas marginalis]|uniref:tyrosine-protein phosphatase n=1 Tax=Pseudomonas marginalis TaxID=298 RepID=UPI0024800650|nr:tyrosine-protein phosphatase [Pseudomonas marginalis]WGT27967.1 tyrosine-protein phosphatase [Pseudomonas marginalis]